MISEVPSFYLQWRAARGRPALLRETLEGFPPERLLQAIWARQRIQRDALKSNDGRSLRVLHPGFWNREPGPDFRDAVVQFGAEPPVVGDIEIDLRSDGWRSHGHDRNPAFGRVVLHVVWDAKGKATVDCPTLTIANRLDAPLGELSQLLEGELPPPLREEQQGRCCAPLKGLEVDALRELLREAARVRLESRASQLRARARDVGWEHSLMEGLLRGLGYKHNAWPMQRLGELLPRLRAALSTAAVREPLDWQALLLGVSGLLPADVKQAGRGTGDYLRSIWDVWWRERDRFSEVVLPAKVWRMAGIRPANHPHRRLALAAHWLAAPDFHKRLESWFGGLAGTLAKDDESRLGAAVLKLVKVLEGGSDPFWSRHWTLRSRPMDKPQPLLGATRVTDLAVNVVLPWFYVRAVEGRNSKWADAAQRVWERWPAAEDNAVLRHARARLLGNARRSVLKTAADQQGLLQVLRDFCDHSNAICEDCRFPQLVSEWAKTP